MGMRLEWTTGSTGFRRGARAETRYTFQDSLHPGAMLVAMGSPVFATFVVLWALLLRV